MAPRNKRGERTGRMEDGTKVVLPGSSKGSKGYKLPKIGPAMPVKGKSPAPGKKPAKPGTMNPVIFPVKSRPVKGKFPLPGKKPAKGKPTTGRVKKRPVKAKYTLY